jgi:hypothetical protein
MQQTRQRRGWQLITNVLSDYGTGNGAEWGLSGKNPHNEAGCANAAAGEGVVRLFFYRSGEGNRAMCDGRFSCRMPRFRGMLSARRLLRKSRR